MPPSKSSNAKAAWERARKYAKEQGVTVKEARSILAQQKDKPVAQAARESPITQGNNAESQDS